jgi:hypothetical protein
LLHVRQRFLERPNPFAQVLLERDDPCPDGKACPQLVDLERLGDVVIGSRLEGPDHVTRFSREVNTIR